MFRLISAVEEGVTDRRTALLILGSRFRVALGNRIAPWESDEASDQTLSQMIILILGRCTLPNSKLCCYSFGVRRREIPLFVVDEPKAN